MDTTHTAILFQIQSFLILLMIYLAVYLRRKRQTHVRLAAVAITWDILLVLQIELSRGAINKASQAVQNTWPLNLHVSIAVSTVILYFFMIHTGRKILRGDIYIRPKHRVLGMSVLVLRTLTFITSFFALQR